MVLERNILEDNSCIMNVTDRSGIEQDRYFSTEVYILVWRVGQMNELKSRETNVGYQEVLRRKIKLSKRIMSGKPPSRRYYYRGFLNGEKKLAK